MFYGISLLLSYLFHLLKPLQHGRTSRVFSAEKSAICALVILGPQANWKLFCASPATRFVFFGVEEILCFSVLFCIFPAFVLLFGLFQMKITMVVVASQPLNVT